METIDRAAVRLGSVLAVVMGAWALVSMASPFGAVAGTGAALFGLTFGVLAVAAKAWGRWRQTALVGVGCNCLALFVSAAEVVYAVVV